VAASGQESVSRPVLSAARWRSRRGAHAADDTQRRCGQQEGPTSTLVNYFGAQAAEQFDIVEQD